MASTQTNPHANTLPFVISDSTNLVKVGSVSDGTATFRVNRPDDALWQWLVTDNYFFYGKNPDNQAKPFLSAFNEFSARYIAGVLGINYQPIAVLNTVDGWKIGTVIDLGFLVNLQESDRSSLLISEEDKVVNFISHIFLADTNGNAGSVLVHRNKKDISRVDFERCFGYNGTTYNQDVLDSFGAINSGPFSGEISGMLSSE